MRIKSVKYDKYGSLYQVIKCVPLPPEFTSGRMLGWNKKSECDTLRDMSIGDSFLCPRGSLACVYAVARALDIGVRAVVWDSKLGASMQMPKGTCRVFKIDLPSSYVRLLTEEDFLKITIPRQSPGVIARVSQETGLTRVFILAVRTGKFKVGTRIKSAHFCK